jgi:hypothetical protein
MSKILKLAMQLEKKAGFSQEEQELLSEFFSEDLNILKEELKNLKKQRVRVYDIMDRLEAAIEDKENQIREHIDSYREDKKNGFKNTASNKKAQVLGLGTSQQISSTRQEDIKLAEDVNITIAINNLFDGQNIYDEDYLGNAMTKIIHNSGKCLSKEEFKSAIAMLSLQNYFNAFTKYTPTIVDEIKAMLKKYTY